MRQVTAATIIFAMIGGSVSPLRAEDTAQGLRDAIDANTADRASADTALDAEPTFLTEEALDHLVAPVALYPDALLAQVLVAATYPLQVVEADRLLKQKDDLSDEVLGERLKAAAWDPSVTVLASGFPTVIERMSDQLEWTEKLGDAMVNQDDDVLAAVQRKREEAKETGYLADNQAQVVEQDDSGQIAIRPADPKVVYVPSYDPDVVYTSRPTAQPYIAPVTQAQSPIANPLVAGALAFGGALLVQQLFGKNDDDRNNDGWDDYWHRSRPIDWKDRQFYPRPSYRTARGDRNLAWSSERDRYWNPDQRRWQRNTPEARQFYARERRDALGWVVVDDPQNGRPAVRAFRNENRWTEADQQALRNAQRDAARREQALARTERAAGRRQALAEERRADAIAAERRQARTAAAAKAAQQQAREASAKATKDASARAAAERARAAADAKQAAAAKAAADARATQAARAEAQRKAAADARAKRQAAAKAEQARAPDAAADAKSKQAADAKARQAADAKDRQAADAKAKQTADAKDRQAADAKDRQASDAKAKQAADAKARQAADAKDRQAADAKAKQAADAKARQAADAKARQAADAKAKQAADAKARQAADAKAKQAADAKAKQAADAKASRPPTRRPGRLPTRRPGRPRTRRRSRRLTRRRSRLPLRRPRRSRKQVQKPRPRRRRTRGQGQQLNRRLRRRKSQPRKLPRSSRLGSSRLGSSRRSSKGRSSRSRPGRIAARATPVPRAKTIETAARTVAIGLKQRSGTFRGIENAGQEGVPPMLTQLKEAIRRSGERARHRRGYRALMRLDDHLLRDVGIPRDEIYARLGRGA